MQARRFAFGPYVLDTKAGALLRKGEPVPLSFRAMLLLTAFLDRPGEVLTKSDLIDAAWQGAAVEEGNLSVQIAALRKLLGQSPEGGDWITTVPRVGYRFARTPHPDEGGDAPGEENDADRRRPSIAVMPFANLSGESEQDYFADGITEDIITALGSYRWFIVIARNSSFTYKNSPIDPKQIASELGVRYLLEGSVRKSGESVRISARLVDAATSAQLWAERYDLAVAEVFAIQDEIAERVVGAIEPELVKTEAKLAPARHTGNMTAWDLVRQGTWRFHQVTRPTHVEARELFREACRLDPRLPEAHIWRARLCVGLIAYGWSDDPAADRQEGLEAALRAIYLDEKNPYAHYAFATLNAFSNGLEQAILASERAIELSPSFALGYFSLGIAHLFSGRGSEAIAPLRRGLKLSPHDPQNPVWSNFLALAQLFAGDPEGALQTSTRALGTRPDWRPIIETVACCYAATGKWEDARRCVRQMGELQRLPYGVLAPLWEKNPQWREQVEDLLRKAGWTHPVSPIVL
jgi:TolB-like protein